MYNLELSALDTGDELFTNVVDTMAKTFSFLIDIGYKF
jgi:hypothetical protein